MNNESTYKQIVDQENPTVIENFSPHHSYAELSLEKDIEDKFIKQLINQGYSYLDLSGGNHEQILLNNLRKQLEKLNGFNFSDDLWAQIKNTWILNSQDDALIRSSRIHDKDYIRTFTLETGEQKNIRLINKERPLANSLQVLHQYQSNNTDHNQRYDVTILVNGLPLIQIELKRPTVKLREAFNQSIEYRKSFPELFSYIGIFVISNVIETKYFANTTRFLNVDGKEFRSKTSDSYKFTIYWTDANNQKIQQLFDFAETFFAQHTILNLLTKYTIFTEDKKLLVMRPYQIVATEKIVNKVRISNSYKEMLGTSAAGGYIWHTTGSGKTLTSFKTAQIISSLDFVDKVLFVVDRKDLDYQTMKEFNKFQKDCVNSSTSTKVLTTQLESENPREKIIVTTIQKLSRFIDNNKAHKIYNKHVVIIFDECHRSQFGSMHDDITNNFKKYNIFGFTGTPIFKENTQSVSAKKIADNIEKVLNVNLTTQAQFGDCLHIYNIINAIEDNNVLKFKYSFVQTISSIKNNMTDDNEIEPSEIDWEKMWLNDERISEIVKYILNNFERLTCRNSKIYSHNVTTNVKNVAINKNIVEKRKLKNISGFNSIFAVHSIDQAKKYYEEFKRQLSSRDDIDLNIATIFSYSTNCDVVDQDDYLVEENNETTESLNDSDKEFLEKVIDEYNQKFSTNWNIYQDGFQGYYKDISLRMKNREIDILIVVNMFLTGFDAPTLNTLWVDKFMKNHGLMQSFSRTNRILNEIKTCGNIVSFVPLKKRLNDAIKLFGNDKGGTLITLRSFNEYFNGYFDQETQTNIKGYKAVVNELLKYFPLENSLTSIKDKKDFIALFGEVLIYLNLLRLFDEFNEESQILSENKFTRYLANYNNYYEQIRKEANKNKQDISEDIVFEIGLVKQNDIDLPYILNLINDNGTKCEEFDVKIRQLIEASFSLRNRKDLIEKFIEKFNEEITNNKNLNPVNEWKKFIDEQKINELNEIISKHNLKHDQALQFMRNCIENDEFKSIGTEIDDLLPPISRFSKPKDGELTRDELKKIVTQDLKNYFKRFKRD